MSTTDLLFFADAGCRQVSSQASAWLSRAAPLSSGCSSKLCWAAGGSGNGAFVCLGNENQQAFSKQRVGYKTQLCGCGAPESSQLTPGTGQTVFELLPLQWVCKDQIATLARKNKLKTTYKQTKNPGQTWKAEFEVLPHPDPEANCSNQKGLIACK